MNFFVLRVKKRFAAFPLFLLCIAFLVSCAAAKKNTEMPGLEYRVALVNAGTYSAVYNQAVAVLSSHSEISLITGDRLATHLGGFSLTRSSLAEAENFEDVAAVEGIDFALVLMPAPAAYPAGHIGLKSVNWRQKTVRSIPAVEIPKQSSDWLTVTRNGWIVINSNPAGAIISVDGRAAGISPLLMMANGNEISVNARWTKKVDVSEKITVKGENRVLISAPEEYIAKINKKGAYQSLQEADEKYGEYFFIGIYVICIFGGVVLLFYNPFSS